MEKFNFKNATTNQKKAIIASLVCAIVACGSASKSIKKGKEAQRIGELCLWRR